jgi:hypothetical protein
MPVLRWLGSISEANSTKDGLYPRLTRSTPTITPLSFPTTEIGGEEKELPRGVAGSLGINGSDQF